MEEQKEISNNIKEQYNFLEGNYHIDMGLDFEALPKKK